MDTSDDKIDGELTYRANKSTKIYYTLHKTILSHQKVELDVKLKI